LLQIADNEAGSRGLASPALRLSMRRLIISALLLIWIGYQACGGEEEVGPAVKVRRREKIIFDFERSAHAARWRPSHISKSPFQAWNRRFASKGYGSLAFDLDAGRTYPGIKLTAPRGRAFSWPTDADLRFDLFNPQNHPVTLYLRIDSLDKEGRALRSTEDFSARPGPNRIRLPLRDFGRGRLNPARVTRLILFAIEPKKTLRLYLDQLRLETAPEVEIPVDNAFLFDFGPKGSPVMPGFVRVTPQDVLSSDKPFGFSTPPARAGTAAYNIDSLSDDYVYTPYRKRTEFCVRLPNGRYAVGLFLRAFDSLDLPAWPWSVLANGKLKKKRGVSALSFYSTKGYYRGFEVDYGPDTDVWEEFAGDNVPFYSFQAAVNDGVLRVTFDSCSIYAMMVWPAQQADWGERLVRQVEQMRKNEFYEYNFWLRRAAKATPSAEAVLMPVSYLKAVGPDFVPPGKTGPAACSVSAAPGEYEPVALAFRAPVEYKNISARATDFVGGAGVIKASAADICLAKLFPKGEHGVYELIPTMLEPVGGQTLRPNITREFWVDICVPDDASPGDYKGEITIESEGRQSLTVGITITVRPFRLPDDVPVSYAMYYGKPSSFKGHYRRFYKGYGKWEQVVGAEMQNMREHGFNTLSIWGPRCFVREGALQLDFAARDRLLKLCRKHGLALRHPVDTRVIDCAYSLIRQGLKEFSPEFNKAYLDVCRRVVAWAEKNDLPMLLYVVDEPRETGLNWWNRNLEDTLKYLDLLKSVPNARTYIPITGDENNGVDYSILADKLDVVATHPTKSCRKLMARAGKLCLYNAGQDRLSWGFYVWKSGAVGRREWGYQWINQPYNPLDGGNWAIAYPSPHGLLPTVGEKRIREGIDDYRYIYALETVMAQAQAAGRDISAASDLLGAIRKSLPDYLNPATERTRDLDYELDEWRERIAAEIEKLTPGRDDHGTQE